MHTRLERRSRNRKDGFGIPLILLFSCFLAGIVLGHVWAAGIPVGTGQELERYLRDYSVLDSAAVSWFSALLIYFRYPVAVFLLGLVSVGVVLIPALTVVCGLFLSFSVCCFASCFGRSGIYLAMAVLGFRVFWTLPCYFALAVPALRHSAALAGQHFIRGKRMRSPEPERYSWLRFCVVAALLFVGVLIELTFCPQLISDVLTKLIP